VEGRLPERSECWGGPFVQFQSRINIHRKGPAASHLRVLDPYHIRLGRHPGTSNEVQYLPKTKLHACHSCLSSSTTVETLHPSHPPRLTTHPPQQPRQHRLPPLVRLQIPPSPLQRRKLGRCVSPLPIPLPSPPNHPVAQASTSSTPRTPANSSSPPSMAKSPAKPSPLAGGSAARRRRLRQRSLCRMWRHFRDILRVMASREVRLWCRF
jgi:hypothetical protein